MKLWKLHPSRIDKKSYYEYVVLLLFSFVLMVLLKPYYWRVSYRVEKLLVKFNQILDSYLMFRHYHFVEQVFITVCVLSKDNKVKYQICWKVIASCLVYHWPNKTFEHKKIANFVTGISRQAILIKIGWPCSLRWTSSIKLFFDINFFLCSFILAALEIYCCIMC